MLFVHLFIQNVHTAVVLFAWLLKNHFKNHNENTFLLLKSFS